MLGSSGQTLLRLYRPLKEKNSRDCFFFRAGATIDGHALEGAVMPKITFIARMTVKPGRDAEFVRCCRELEDYVRGHEPEVLAYEFFRLREPSRYAVIESFKDEASEHRHMSSAKLAELAPKIAACLDGTWEREYFDPLA
jgi:(4S)-4-hydroxy-5-phosphonooxypentane-2,3-dione isomerase